MKSVGQKKRPKKNLWISVKSVGQNFHRISRNFGRLANGSRPICAAIVFGHADFADDADFSSWEGLVPQISQIYTDFYGISGESLCPIPGGIFSSWDYFCPTDFTDIHRFFMESLMNRFVRSQGVSATTEQVASAKFRVIR